MHVHRPIGVLKLGSETCPSTDPECYDNGVPCCFTAEQGNIEPPTKSCVQVVNVIFFSRQRHSVFWVENGRTTPCLPPQIINNPGLVHPCSLVEIQTYILNRLTSLLMCLFCWNCFVMWKYVNIIWLDRRCLWICEVEVEDGAMMNVCA